MDVAVESTDEAVELSLEVDRSTIAADDVDQAFVTGTSKDAEGREFLPFRMS